MLSAFLTSCLRPPHRFRPLQGPLKGREIPSPDGFDEAQEFYRWLITRR